MLWLHRKLDMLPRPVASVLGLMLLLIVGAVDWHHQGPLAFSVLYLVPIALVALYGGRYGAIALCAIAAKIWFWVELNPGGHQSWAVATWNTAVHVLIFVMVIKLIMDLKQAYEHESHLARTDGLTGAVNWRFFQETLTAELNRRNRYLYAISLAYIDIDNFKQVNDQFGHRRGDQFLQAVAAEMMHSVRASDLVARVGGDEFACFMPHTNAHDAQRVIDRLYQRLLSKTDESALPVGFSIGVVTDEIEILSVEDLLKTADKLMYEAKAAGKNRVVYQSL